MRKSGPGKQGSRTSSGSRSPMKRGPGRPPSCGRGPGRPPSTRSESVRGRSPLKRRVRPPLHGANIIRRGLDRSRKVVRPPICHLCNLPIDENDA